MKESGDSLTGKFRKTIVNSDGTTTNEIAGSSDFHSYQPNAPFQKINHYKAVWNNSLFLGQSQLEATIGFQQNRRKEFETPDEYGLYFLLNTLNYDFKYTLPEKNDWKFTTGINGMWQNSQNKGTEFLVPEYNLFDFGIFAIANKKIGKLDISGGIRFDTRSETGKALYLNEEGGVVLASDANATQRFGAFSQTFNGTTGSLGATYQISESIYTKLNISRGFRAPNIAELASNGVHEGTQRYEIGNSNLKPESSLQFDYAIGMNTTHVFSRTEPIYERRQSFHFQQKTKYIRRHPRPVRRTSCFSIYRR